MARKATGSAPRSSKPKQTGEVPPQAAMAAASSPAAMATAAPAPIRSPQAAVASAPATQPNAGNRRRPSQDEVARRAFEIWEAKGRPQGLDAENWREAERQLLNGH